MAATGASFATRHGRSAPPLLLHPFEWLATQGPTGHGKSTLLQILGGLDRPTSVPRGRPAPLRRCPWSGSATGYATCRRNCPAVSSIARRAQRLGAMKNGKLTVKQAV